MTDLAAPAISGMIESVFPGSGEMAQRCRAFDWSATPLGPVTGWSYSLRTTAGIVIASRQPMFLWWGPELVQVYNDAYRPSFGERGRHPQALGMRGRECWTDIWPVIGPQIEQVMATGEPTWHEDQYLPIERNGRLEDVWWTYSYSPVHDDDGSIGGTLVVCQETTKRMIAEAGRAEAWTAAHAARADAIATRERLAAVIEQAPVLINTFVGPEHRFESANAWFRRVTGKALDVLGRPVREAQPELAGTDFYELLDRVYATGEPFIGTELPAPVDMRGNGVTEERFFNFIYQPIRDAGGAVDSIASVATDVTDLVRARRAAESAEARLRFALASARLGAWQLELATGEMASSDQCRANFGRPPADAAGEPRFDYADLLAAIHPDDLSAMQRQVSDALERGTTYAAEYRVLWPDGSEHWIEAHGSAIRDTDGRAVRMNGVTAEITERRRAATERERLLHEAEVANRAKGEFLAVMSHELRTPLNAIGGYAELMEMGIRGPVTDEQRADLSRIQKSQRHLLGLINGVLNYVKIDAGAVHYEVSDVPVDNVLASCEALIAPQARAKRIALTFTGCESELSVRADREKVQQIVLNLLSNAVKFTDVGGRVALECVASSASGSNVSIHVTDTGPGIAANQLERIFQPFVQLDARLTRTQEGTGLGLAISRDLARGMGGDLLVESELGVGSTFMLTLPCAE